MRRTMRPLAAASHAGRLVPPSPPCMRHAHYLPVIRHGQPLAPGFRPRSALRSIFTLRRLQHTDAGPSTRPSAAAPQSTDLLEHYRGLVARGKLKWDDEQVRCVIKLRELLEELKQYEPPLDLLARLGPRTPVRGEIPKQDSWWKGKAKEESGEGLREMVRVLTGEEELANLKTPKGMMITGPPGTGKSMLLSLFFTLLPTAYKRRWHYHAFTLWLYRQVFKEMEKRRRGDTDAEKGERMERAAKRGWRSVFAGGRWESGEDNGIQDETIPFVIARDMMLDYHVLYFDELQLVDASSAALLRDVLSWYWRLGGVIVTCSNRVPEDLYHHGVQKDRMIGFLDALRSRCDVVELDGGRDWRRGVGGEQIPFEETWFSTGDSRFDDNWGAAVGDSEAGSTAIGVYGRRLHVPAAAGRVCRFEFTDLCEQPLGPADYISLASTYSTFFIDAVPILLLKNKNEARRLINLVDALYEARCQVFIRATTPIEGLFFPDATNKADDLDSLAAEALSESLHLPSLPNVSIYNPFEREKREKAEAGEGKKAGAFGVLGIWTGEDERFAYKRAVSRLVEMTTSPTYAREEWIPVHPSGRSWESVVRDSPPPTPRRMRAASAPSTPSESSKRGEDFADEARYSRPGKLLPPNPEYVSRSDPPVIDEHHVWGVVDEWGPKAGKWGRGAKAFGPGKQEGDKE